LKECANVMVTIVICMRPGRQGIRRVGVVVRRVVDVSAGTPLFADADLFDAPLAMVKDRVTTMHRAFPREGFGPSLGQLEEVA
jgi:two-component system chemotaxis sensor kinase CheA